MNETAKALKNVPLFENLSESERENLVQQAKIIHFKPLEIAVKEGDKGDSVFIILSGIFEVVKTDDKGESHLLATLRENEIFGEMSFLTGEPRSSTVTALVSSTAMEVKKSQFKQFLESRPELLLNLINLMESRISGTVYPDNSDWV